MQIYKNPGIFFEETIASASGANTFVRTPKKLGAPVTGAKVGVAGFVGTAPRGVLRQPIKITSWNQYMTEFGAFDVNSMLAYSVKGFFENGGTECYVVRTCKYNDNSPTAISAKLAVNDKDSGEVFSIYAKSEGIWGNDISIEVTDLKEATKTFTLNVYYKNIKAETYITSKDQVEDDLEGSLLVKAVPAKANDKDVVALALTSLTGGVDGLTGMTDTDYIDALKALTLVKINTLAVPNVTTKAVHEAMIDFNKRVVPLIEAPLGKTAGEVATYKATLKENNATMLYPYLKVADPIGVGKRPTKLVSPSGHVAGVIARVQQASGVWNAVAGVDAHIDGVIDLERIVTPTDSAILNPVGVICLRKFDLEGIVIWGARTMSNDPKEKYLTTRFVLNYIEDSLEQSMRWSNFKSNQDDLWSAIKSNTEVFLRGIWSKGGLKGAKEDEAFIVTCDNTINTPESVDEGITFVDIALALQKPNEFTVFRLNVTV